MERHLWYIPDESCGELSFADVEDQSPGECGTQRANRGIDHFHGHVRSLAGGNIFEYTWRSLCECSEVIEPLQVWVYGVSDSAKCYFDSGLLCSGSCYDKRLEPDFEERLAWFNLEGRT